jgi:hypothetical protein
MRKVLLCIALTTVFLSGCTKNETTKKTAESTKESTIVSSTRKEVELKVYYPEYNIEKKTYKISGKVDEKKKVTASINGGQKDDVKITASGSIDYSGTIPETDTDILFSDGEKEIIITVKSLVTLEKEKIEKQAELDKQKQEEEKKESETTVSKSSEESYEPTKESSISNNIKAEVTKDQKELLVVFTQQDLDDRDISYKYQVYDAWNVVTNDTSELKRYIITTQDKKAGRVKSIYEWTGKKEDGATLIYLLVGGEEYVNYLR